MACLNAADISPANTSGVRSSSATMVSMSLGSSPDLSTFSTITSRRVLTWVRSGSIANYPSSVIQCAYHSARPNELGKNQRRRTPTIHMERRILDTRREVLVESDFFPVEPLAVFLEPIIVGHEPPALHPVPTRQEPLVPRLQPHRLLTGVRGRQDLRPSNR